MKFVELFGRIQRHMGWDDAKTVLWFTTKNAFMAKHTPIAFWLLRPAKCEKIILSLIEENTTDATGDRHRDSPGEGIRNL